MVDGLQPARALRPERLAFPTRVKRYAGLLHDKTLAATHYTPVQSSAASSTAAKAPLLRQATALDWLVTHSTVRNRFRLRSRREGATGNADHFKDYNDIVALIPRT